MTLRVVSEIGNLRRRDAYQAIREATVTTARRESFRIVQLSIQRTHLHLLVEAENKQALAAGMQGFEISAAKHLNAAIGKTQGGERRRGKVFPDRYHAVVITSPRQARNVLSYIMNNWRHHGEHAEGAQRSWRIDWFSSASSFPDWREYGNDEFMWETPPRYDPLIVYQPRTWLLREGWKRHGLISCHEVPVAKT